MPTATSQFLDARARLGPDISEPFRRCLFERRMKMQQALEEAIRLWMETDAANLTVTSSPVTVDPYGEAVRWIESHDPGVWRIIQPFINRAMTEREAHEETDQQSAQNRRRKAS